MSERMICFGTADAVDVDLLDYTTITPLAIPIRLRG